MKKFFSTLLFASLFISCNKLKDYLPHTPQPKIVTIEVPGTSNPWLAGMPNGTTALNGGGEDTDVAPDQSPKLVSVTLSSGSYIEVSNVSGLVKNGAAYPNNDADGGGFFFHEGGAEHGKSGVTAPINSLLGVFLDDDIPSGEAPEALDFNVVAGKDYVQLRPKLNQVFFIGDGKTSTGAQQKISVPTNAKRLFLGTMDGSEWNNNEGSFKATVTLNKK